MDILERLDDCTFVWEYNRSYWYWAVDISVFHFSKERAPITAPATSDYSTVDPSVSVNVKI